MPQPGASPHPEQNRHPAMATPEWRTLEVLHLPASAIDFRAVARPYPEPDAARELRESLFERALASKRDELAAVNPANSYEVRRDGDSRSLFVERPDGSTGKVMWDGMTVSTAASSFVRGPEGVVLEVFPIRYSEWTACRDPRFAQAYREASLPLPFAGLGVSVLIETSDGLIPLTRRGLETPVYPARLYSPGGGPKPSQGSTESLIEEIVEETGLEAGRHFDTGALVALAYVTDRLHQGSEHERPEVVFYLPSSVPIAELVRERNRSVAEKGARPTDVWSLEPILADPVSIAGKVRYDGNQMCPPTEAALVHLMYYKLCAAEGAARAAEEIGRQLDALSRYERRPYVPPITLREAELPGGFRD